MSLSEQIQDDTKAAMKQRDRTRVGALRMLGAALKNAEIEAGRPLTEEEEQIILRRQLKQRDESAEAFRRAGREEQAASESAEAEIVRSYLPEPLSQEELEEIVDSGHKRNRRHGHEGHGYRHGPGHGALGGPRRRTPALRPGAQQTTMKASGSRHQEAEMTVERSDEAGGSGNARSTVLKC